MGYGPAVFNSRSRDVQEHAVLARGEDFPDLASGEGLVQMTYGAQVAPWPSIRPTVQYITEPGAFYGEEIENTLIVGLQVKAAL